MSITYSGHKIPNLVDLVTPLCTCIASFWGCFHLTQRPRSGLFRWKKVLHWFFTEKNSSSQNNLCLEDTRILDKHVRLVHDKKFSLQMFEIISNWRFFVNIRIRISFRNWLDWVFTTISSSQTSSHVTLVPHDEIGAWKMRANLISWGLVDFVTAFYKGSPKTKICSNVTNWYKLLYIGPSATYKYTIGIGG